MKIISYHIIKLTVVIFFILSFNFNIANSAGLLKPINGSESDVYMKNHHVNVVLNNGFAKTEVDQVFVNQGNYDLEAIYSFPVPKQASLSELSLWIDGKEIIGEVLKKEKAKQIYREQKFKGNETALAQKNDYKNFEIKVYPVKANDETRVRLVYYQPLEIDLNVGRYVYPLEEGGINNEGASFWSVDNIVQESFKFNLRLKSAFPVKDLRLPSYQNKAIIKEIDSHNFSDDDTENLYSNNNVNGEIYDINLELDRNTKLSKDIVFYYRLNDNIPARLEIIPYKENSNKAGTFMAVITPGSSLQTISEGSDWTFVLDISGSMNGNKISVLAEGVSKVIKKMSPLDRFRIVTFNDKAHDFSGGYINATKENIDHMVKEVKNIRVGGGTALYSGLIEAYKGLDEDRTTGIILVTDGVANIGPSKHADLLNLLKNYDLRIFTFVIGNSANQPLLETIAKESGGFSMNVSSNDDIIGRIIQAKAKVTNECIYGAKLKFYGQTIKDITPVKIGNLYMGQQLVVFGKYFESGNVKIELTGRIAGEDKTWSSQIFLPETDTDNPEIERLWALSSINDTMAKIRENGDSYFDKKKIVKLAEEYSMVTDYTSMVVIKQEEVEEAGIKRKNDRRVKKERKAQAKKIKKPIKNYQASNRHSNTEPRKSKDKMFSGYSPSIGGGGPVGPFFLGIAYWIRRRKLKK